MSKTAVTVLLAVLIGAVCVRPVQADRPGSYDRVLSGPARPGRAGHPERESQHPQKGPLRPGYGRPHQHGSISFFVGAAPGYFYWPMYGGGVYDPTLHYTYFGPAGIYYDPAASYAGYYTPPVYAPAELAYGPLAVERFLGVRRDLVPIPPLAPPAAEEPGAVDEKADWIAPKLRKSNDAARQRARRFLAFGDALFEQQRFHEAGQRYKSAIEAAPDLAEAYYRQGFALIAVSQYRLAAKALRIAVELDPGMPREDFQLNQLYRDNRLAKIAHLEQLSGEALDRSGHGDLLFLVGMFLYCDGQVERAQRFLQKSADVGGTGATFIAPLLEAVPLPDASEPVTAPAESVDVEIDI